MPQAPSSVVPLFVSLQNERVRSCFVFLLYFALRDLLKSVAERRTPIQGKKKNIDDDMSGLSILTQWRPRPYVMRCRDKFMSFVRNNLEKTTRTVYLGFIAFFAIYLSVYLCLPACRQNLVACVSWTMSPVLKKKIHCFQFNCRIIRRPPANRIFRVPIKHRY